ncbi:hypothetical protein [Methanoplanus endosymbiosus]|uniref:Xylose isomerase-like TIM barrel domain-containing protein n=1 Tax=Methanoplanus endosymbiosus TaxID=33865 RepID=A0A9E7TMI7_9EURY|nr:hypothetical protein [Methanoplanus endosymbiosus]UUX93301.1 hypothetical protein L6E24_04025 [Methanoplanus endosymbiosus]
MQYKEFINFSVYEYDLKKFGGEWESIRKFLAENELDGVEMLVNFDEVPESIPPDVVGAVHLPSFTGWYRLKTDNSFKVPDYFSDGGEKYFYGGRSYSEVIENFMDCLTNVSSLNPAYGVYHGGYIETEQSFCREKFCSDSDVLTETAEFLNETASRFPGGEPPFDIFIENLWSPGLTFLDSGAVAEFCDSLKFKKWGLMLDTGHLMNASKCCYTEEEGIDCVLSVLDEQERKVINNIRGLHFHYSASAEYHNNMAEPENFNDMNQNDKFICIMEHFGKIDHHRPFSSERCSEIIDYVKPDYLTHEFIMQTYEEIDSALKQQKNAICGKKI